MPTIRFATELVSQELRPGPSASRIFPAWWSVGIAALAVLIYAPVLKGGYFIDDWEFLLAHPNQDIFGAFQRLHPFYFYRPLQLSIVAIFQSLFGPSTIPTHLFQIAVLVTLAMLVANACRELGASPRGAAVGALFVACSQAAVAGVAGIDTISQTLGTLAGVAACWWLYVPARRGEQPQAWLPLAAFAVALLSKESSFGYLPLLGFLAYRAETIGGRSSRLRGAVRAASFLLIATAYWTCRAMLGGRMPALGTGNYDISFGTNLLVHPIMLWFAALLPVSTVRVFTGIATRAWLWPLVGTLGAATVAAILVVAFKRAGRLRWGLGWCVAATSTLAPVVPLTHVSELYAFSLLPFIGVALGLAADWWLTSLAYTTASRWVTPVLALLITTNALEARIKAASMEQNGRMAAALNSQLVSRFQRLPPHTEIALLDAPTPLPDYSVFRVQGFKLVDDKTLLRLSGRPDLAIHRIDAGDLAAASPAAIGRRSVVLTLERGGTEVRALRDPTAR